jgi:hypothetical protein
MPTPIGTPETTNLTTQKIDAQAEYQQLVDAINTLLPGVDPFEVGGASVKRAELLSIFQQFIDASKATKALRLELVAQLAKERAAFAEAKPMRADFKVFLQGKYGRTSPLLQKYGFVQNRRPRKTATNKAAGVAAAKQTREALGTKGRQQKAGLGSQASERSQAAVTGRGNCSPGAATPTTPTPGPVTAEPAEASARSMSAQASAVPPVPA